MNTELENLRRELRALGSAIWKLVEPSLRRLNLLLARASRRA